MTAHQILDRELHRRPFQAVLIDETKIDIYVASPTGQLIRPSAWLGVQPDTGFAAICAWHDDIEPYSKEAAERLARSLGLHATHGICPACKARLIAEAKEARP